MAGRVLEPSQSDSKRLKNLLQTAEMTEAEADEIFKSTNCLLCRYPKSHAKNHHMTRCGFLKKYGIACTHDYTTDSRVSETSRQKSKDRRTKNVNLDADNEKKAAEIEKKVQTKKKKDTAAKEQAEADAAGMKTFGADGKDVKSPSGGNELIQKNLESQSSKAAGSGRAAGIARAVGELGYF